ncbi:MAG: SHD1 domain-containing protein [Planctomycetota bacterium]
MNAKLIIQSVVTIILLIVSLPQIATATPQDVRTWKDASGKFEVKATFVRVDGDNVVIKKEDGGELSVPLNKLSPIDQGYVEGRRSSSATPKDDNPFQPMTSQPKSSDTGSNSADTSDPTVPKSLSVDFSDCPETTIAISSWQPDLEEQPKLSLKLKPIALKPKADFFEKYVRTAVNPVAGKAVITHHFSRHGKPATTRMEFIDLQTGQSIANASGEGLWTALAIHDDGERIVVQNVADEESTKGQLGTVRLRGKKIVPLDLWKPYETMSDAGKEKIVRFCRFINDGKLLTLSQNGRVVIWDFESRKPVRRFQYHGACQPALTNDRKHLAICGGDIFGIVNLENPEANPSVKKAPLMNYWLSSGFSPSCKRFAAATMQKLMVWDVESGEVLFEGKVPGIGTNGNLYFPHEDFVMINNDKLVEYSSGIKLWRYHGAAPVNISGEMAFVHLGRDGGKMLPMELPHPKAMELLDAAKSQSDLFVLKKGSKIGIDLNGVPSQYRGDVEQSLKENIERKGFVFGNDADVVLKAAISGPTNEAVSYHFAGSFVVRQFNSTLSIDYNGKSLWSSRANNVPGAVSGRGKDVIKKQLDKAGRQPNIKFFASAQLPDYLQKPSEGSGSNRDAQMLGSSAIGINGIQD